MQEITLANYKNKTAQEIYDYVARHLLTQNAKAKPENTLICSYLLPDGKRCAAGCMIAPEEYSVRMEGCSWYGLQSKGFTTSSLHDVLISDLQNIHDTKDTYQWEACLENLAFKSGLTPFKLERKA